jgi:hypothetical protein
MNMNRKVIFFLVSMAYLAVIVYGLYSVYTVEATLRVKEPPPVKPENRIAIAHTEIFGKLERPQVIFNHAKHEEAYKTEGCNACHPEKDGQVIFDFPKNLKKRDKTSVMNAYHDECIECHKKKSRENKKSGPVTCADCHNKETAALKVPYPVVEFDFFYHDKHVKKLKEKIGKDDCGLCHHSYDPEEEDEALRLVYEPGTEESCYYCHELGRKRGPELTAITKAAAKKGLSIKEASHQQCLNCHLRYKEEYLKKGQKDAVPTECIKCHTGEFRTVKQLEKIPRPDRDQPKRPLINIKDAKLKGVPFDHEYHQIAEKTCRSCHHETLKACKECHNLTGRPEGNHVNLASAYHDPSSEHSCEGCHNIKKTEKDCFGCHHSIPVTEIDSLGPKKESCATCHSGEIKGAFSRPPLSVAGLDPQKVPNKVKVEVLKKEYEQSEFPHMDIIKKLVDISNKSKLANYFHKDMQTMCEGCHHRSHAAAEVKKDTPPNCRNCHAITPEPRNLDKTTLLSAYHRQCLGCHDKMELEKGRKCADCHKKKADGPAEITAMKNDNVVKQNKTIILNVWRPK